MLQAREREILDYLLRHSDEKVTTSILAKKLNCSDRTVKTTIKGMNEFFNGKPFKIETKAGKGIWLSYPISELDTLLKMVQTHQSQDSDEWQELELIEELLRREYPVSMQELAEFLYTNIKMIQKYLDNVQIFVGYFGIAITREVGKGVSLKGTEVQKRHLNASLIRRKNQLKSQMDFMSQLQEDFPTVNVVKIKNLLAKVIEEQELSVSDYTFYNILIHTTLAILRVSSDNVVKFDDYELSKLQETKEWHTASDYRQMLITELSVEFPEEEIALLAIHFLGAQVNPELEELNKRHYQYAKDHLTEEVYQWLKEIGNQYGYELTKDTLFINNLILHLRPLLNRLQYGVNISNPWLSGVKQEYGEAYEIAVELVVRLERNYSFKISEDDIAFIALHVGAAITRIEQTMPDKVPVLIVCASGLGMSQFIKVKIEQLFSNQIIVLDAVSSVGTDFYSYPCQVILSTIPLEVPGKIVIPISPILDESEQHKINKVLNHMEEKRSILASFLKPELILLNSQVTDWQEAIQLGTDCLKNNKYVTEKYCEQIIEREELSHTTIGNGLAIPHGIESDILKEGIVFMTLEKPILWGTEQVDIVFLLAITTKSKSLFSELFTEILTISQNQEQLQEIRQVKTRKELIRMIKRNEIYGY